MARQSSNIQPCNIVFYQFVCEPFSKFPGIFLPQLSIDIYIDLDIFDLNGTFLYSLTALLQISNWERAKEK